MVGVFNAGLHPFRIISPLRGLKRDCYYWCDFILYFRIISPLRGLKHKLNETQVGTINFRIISPLRGLKL